MSKYMVIAFVTGILALIPFLMSLLWLGRKPVSTAAEMKLPAGYSAGSCKKPCEGSEPSQGSLLIADHRQQHFETSQCSQGMRFVGWHDDGIAGFQFVGFA